MKTLLTFICAALLVGLLSPAASARVTERRFGDQAIAVAKDGNCKNPRKRSSDGAYTLSGLVCDLRGERVNVITFSTKRDEIHWLSTTCTLLPEQWVMVGAGFVVTAYDGNEQAARVGKRVYGGRPYLCSDLGS